jgi:hypothetical protein
MDPDYEEQFRAEVSRDFRSPREKLVEAAHHEAGHAVATVLLHVEFVSVSIIPSEKSRGQCCSRLHPSEECIKVLLAGQIAEVRLHRLDRPDFKAVGDMGWGDDNLRIDEYIQHIAGDRDVEQLRDSLKAQTEQLISVNWDFVKAVAGELLDGKTLVQADTDRIRAALPRRMGG